MSLKTFPVPPESPLVPNEALRRMYAGMVESRLLEEYLRKRQRTVGRPRVRGQEACRTAALLDLKADDFSSDLYGCATTPYLRGQELSAVLNHRPGAETEVPGLLPELPESRDRLQQAIGVAVCLKRLGLKTIVVFFAGIEEVKPLSWLPHLHRAAQMELPMLFVVLPEIAGKTELKAKLGKATGLSARATAAGVPGIAVDASDAMALYRVTQESIGRARAGGGPALIEGLPFAPFAKREPKKIALPDPIVALGHALLQRGVCDETWLGRVEPTFKARLRSL